MPPWLLINRIFIIPSVIQINIIVYTHVACKAVALFLGGTGENGGEKNGEGSGKGKNKAPAIMLNKNEFPV